MFALIFQVVRLGQLPHSVEPQLLNLGLVVEIPSLPGTPLEVSGEICDPLQLVQYAGYYRGRQYAQCVTSLLVGGKPEDKIYFDAAYLNGKISPAECRLF